MTTFTYFPFQRIRLDRTAILLAVAACCMLPSQAQVQPGRTLPGTQPGRTLPVRRPGTPPAATPAAGTASPMAVEDESENSLNYQEAAADLVLMDYAQRTKRTLLMAPDLPKPTITLRSNPEAPLTEEEYLVAIEKILNFNGIALIPEGEKFLRVVASTTLSQHGVPTAFAPVQEGDEPVEDRYLEDGRFVSRMVELKHIDFNEAKTVIDGFIRTGAQIQTFERTNSILVRDAAENINRILEIISYIDRPIVSREEPNIIQIRYAKAEDVKNKLMEIVSEAQAEAAARRTVPTERTTGSPGTVTRPLPAGVTLPRSALRPGAPVAAATEAFESLVQDAERGVIRGKVQIISDERTNLLIIITRPENMVFFERVIDVLDVETSPDVVVEVFRLEHAVASDVASMLNDLIGNDRSGDSARPAPTAVAGEGSQNLAEFAQRRRDAAAPAGIDAKSKVGQLDAENIKILADERTNALVIMASVGDMATIRELIEAVDIMLSQVIIETVLISLTFSDSIETGVNWVQRAMRVGDSKAYALSGGGGGTAVQNPLSMTETVPQNPGISFFATLLDFNIDVVMRAVKTDSRARIMSSPIITTLDNKEAVVESTDRIYYIEGTTRYDNSNQTTQNIKNEEIGIKLKVTPRINKLGYVVLSIEQEIQDSEGTQPIGGEDLPKLTSRRMGADIAVQSGETVVLGGLARNEMSTSATRVPILGSIPFLGRLFRYDKQENKRTDIIVFLTPRVINLSQEIEREARKRKASLDTGGVWRSDWSGSDLADPISEKDLAAMLKRGEQTVRPPRHALDRELAPLNEKYGLTPVPVYVDEYQVPVEPGIIMAPAAPEVPFEDQSPVVVEEVPEVDAPVVEETP